ncbi:MAG: methylenetetrahydrofolate reductase [Desulfobacterota bacterium]|nr:methylenetetrahydrofolate reductase [Thermodesulfobacteriota bacterium]MDW8001495.1 methylenetetrahydrofolate reductase [Deltaproteobacteria bacterium]
MKTKSNLERVLNAGYFAVTAEVGPPQSADPEVIRKKAKLLSGYVDGFNVTDGQTAVVRMASWAACLIGKEFGLDPIVQMTCRDRNRIALQMDILGIAALGINNVLCLTGDHPKFGNHPHAKGVYDIDSVQLIKIVKDMRDEKKFQNGEPIPYEPRLFIGAAENPFADPFEFRVLRLKKKIEAGADFIQTQIIYNVPKFKEWMKRVCDLGLHEKVKIIAGVSPLKSVGAAKYMKTKIPGMDVPDEIITRLQGVPKDQVPKEGIRICVDIINELKEVKGVAGVHIMAIEWEETVPEIVEAANLYPRPKF